MRKAAYRPPPPPPLPRGCSAENEVTASGSQSDPLWYPCTDYIAGAYKKAPSTKRSRSDMNYPKSECESGIRGYQGLFDSFVSFMADKAMITSVNKNTHFLEVHADGEIDNVCELLSNT